MENKRYLDKVVGSLVRSTKIDYENKEVNTPFSPCLISFFLSPPPLSTSPLSFFSFFSSYCKNTFGLTVDEVEYVWGEYRDNILDKISNEG